MFGSYKTATLSDYSINVGPPTFKEMWVTSSVLDINPPKAQLSHFYSDEMENDKNTGKSQLIYQIKEGVQDIALSEIVTPSTTHTLTVYFKIQIGSGFPIGADVINKKGDSLVIRTDQKGNVVTAKGISYERDITDYLVRGIGKDTNITNSDNSSTILQNQLNFPQGIKWRSPWYYDERIRPGTTAKNNIITGEVIFDDIVHQKANAIIKVKIKNLENTCNKPRPDDHHIKIRFFTTHGAVETPYFRLPAICPPKVPLYVGTSVSVSSTNGILKLNPRNTVVFSFSAKPYGNTTPYYEIYKNGDMSPLGGELVSTRSELVTSDGPGFKTETKSLILGNSPYFYENIFTVVNLTATDLTEGCISFYYSSADGKAERNPITNYAYNIVHNTTLASQIVCFGMSTRYDSVKANTYASDYIIRLKSTTNPDPQPSLAGYFIPKLVDTKETTFKSSEHWFPAVSDLPISLGQEPPYTEVNPKPTFVVWFNTYEGIGGTAIVDVVWYKNGIPFNPPLDGRIKRLVQRSDLYPLMVGTVYWQIANSNWVSPTLSARGEEILRSATASDYILYEARLTFESLREEDIGTYTCQIRTNNGISTTSLSKLIIDQVSKKKPNFEDYYNKSLLYSRKVNLVAAGAAHTSVVKTARIFTYGSNQYGQGGGQDPSFSIKSNSTVDHAGIVTSVYENWPKIEGVTVKTAGEFSITPSQFPNLTSIQLFSITSGLFHSAVVETFNNTIINEFTLGNNYFGQLGHTFNIEPSIDINNNQNTVSFNYKSTYLDSSILRYKPNNFQPNVLYYLRDKLNKKSEVLIYDELLFNVFPQTSNYYSTRAEKANNFNVSSSKQYAMDKPITITVAGGNQTFSYIPNTPFVYGLGANHYGQLGDGTTTNRSTTAGGLNFIKTKPIFNSIVNQNLIKEKIKTNFQTDPYLYPWNERLYGKNNGKYISRLEQDTDSIKYNSTQDVLPELIPGMLDLNYVYYRQPTLRTQISSWRPYWNDCLYQDVQQDIDKPWIRAEPFFDYRFAKTLYDANAFAKMYITPGYVYKSSIEEYYIGFYDLATIENARVNRRPYSPQQPIYKKGPLTTIYGVPWLASSESTWTAGWYVIPCTYGMTTTVIDQAFDKRTYSFPREVRTSTRSKYTGYRTNINDKSLSSDYPRWPTSINKAEYNTSKWPNDVKIEDKWLLQYYSMKNGEIDRNVYPEPTTFERWKSGFLPKSDITKNHSPASRLINVHMYPDQKWRVLNKEYRGSDWTKNFPENWEGTTLSMPGTYSEDLYGLKLLGRPRLDVIVQIKTDNSYKLNENSLMIPCNINYYIGDEILYKWWCSTDMKPWTITIDKKDYNLDYFTNDDIFGEYIEFDQTQDVSFHHYKSVGRPTESTKLPPIGSGMSYLFDTLATYIAGFNIEGMYYDAIQLATENRYNTTQTSLCIPNSVLSSAKPYILFDYVPKAPNIKKPTDPMSIRDENGLYNFPTFSYWSMIRGMYNLWETYEKTFGPIKPNVYDSLYLKTSICLYNMVYFNSQAWNIEEVTDENVSTITDWPNIIKVSPGPEHTLFLDEQGSLYGCGSNEYGQLGGPEIVLNENELLPNQKIIINNEGNNVYSFTLPQEKERVWTKMELSTQTDSWQNMNPESYASNFDLTIKTKKTEKFTKSSEVHNFNKEPKIDQKYKVMPTYYFNGGKLTNGTQLYSDKKCTIKAHSLEDNILGVCCPALIDYLQQTRIENISVDERTWLYNEFNTPWTPGFVGLFKTTNGTIAVFISNWYGEYVKSNYVISKKEATNSFELIPNSKWSIEESNKASSNSGKLYFCNVIDKQFPTQDEIYSLPKLIEKASSLDNSPRRYLEISAGKTHSLFLREDYTAWYLGAPYGEPDNINITKKLKQVMINSVPLTNVIDIKAGWGYSLYLLKDGTVIFDGILGDWEDTIYDWRTNQYKIRLIRKQRNKPITKFINYYNEYNKAYIKYDKIIDMAAGVNHCVFLRQSYPGIEHQLLGFGKNNYGQLGRTNTTFKEGSSFATKQSQNIGPNVTTTNDYINEIVILATFNSHLSAPLAGIDFLSPQQ